MKRLQARWGCTRTRRVQWGECCGACWGTKWLHNRPQDTKRTKPASGLATMRAGVCPWSTDASSVQHCGCSAMHGPVALFRSGPMAAFRCLMDTRISNQSAIRSPYGHVTRTARVCAVCRGSEAWAGIGSIDCGLLHRVWLIAWSGACCTPPCL